MLVFCKNKPIEFEASSAVANHCDSKLEAAKRLLNPIPTKPIQLLFPKYKSKNHTSNIVTVEVVIFASNNRALAEFCHTSTHSLCDVLNYCLVSVFLLVRKQREEEDVLWSER